MQKIVAFIPNLFTLGNLFCGCLAIVFAFSWRLDLAAYMVFLAAFLDFFDGFFARILKVSGELGKQLDSLADMVSFGVVPGVVVFQLLRFDFYFTQSEIGLIDTNEWLAYSAFIIPLFSAYRLAKFNLDTRQTYGFIGLPTPANAILFVSLSLCIDVRDFVSASPFTEFIYLNDIIGNNTSFYLGLQDILTNFIINPYLLAITFVLFSFLLLSELPLFGLKFKNFGWTDNKIRYIFLGISLCLLILFQLIAIPFIVILYILISIVNNLFKITV